MMTMLLARLICSDPDCAAEAEARAATLGELEALACDCGCGLQVLWVEEGAAGTALELVLLA